MNIRKLYMGVRGGYGLDLSGREGAGTDHDRCHPI